MCPEDSLPKNSSRRYPVTREEGITSISRRFPVPLISLSEAQFVPSGVVSTW